MFRRHLAIPFRFYCITDEPGDYGIGVEVIPTPPDALKLADLRTPEGARFPSCYRRLWMFSDAARVLGERVLLVDIDVLVVRDVEPLFAPTDDFVGWRPTATWGHARDRIGGGLYLHTPGTRTHVWESFRGQSSISEARQAGYRGSDQAWISYALRGCPVYGPDAGIYSIRDLANGRHPMPEDARLVQHNGTVKPWSSQVEWVRQAWR